MKLFRLPFHHYLFAIYPIIFLFANNISELSLSSVILPCAVALFIISVFFIILNIFIKNSKKSAIISTLVVIAFYVYGHAYNLISSIHFENLYLIQLTKGNLFFLPLWGILFIFLSYTIMKIKARHFSDITFFINILSITLILLSSFSVVFYEFSNRSKYVDNSELFSGIVSQDSPDIYYIILDGYARSDVLKQVYNYSNDDFIDGLQERGFYIANESRTNYAATFLSFSSSLNMDYINDFSQIIGEESMDRVLPYELIKNNKVMQYLKSKGYKYITFRSGWGATDYNKYADINYDGGAISEFNMVLLRTTMVGPFLAYIADYHEKILFIFNKLEEVPDVSGKKFVFAHIISPHPPYLFGSNGEKLKVGDLSMHGKIWEDKQGYINQIIFVNKRITQVIDEILKKSKTAPIIIIQSDHGSEYFAQETDWKPSEDVFFERMSNLNTYYLPDGGESILYNNITPVNSFRLIFNYYFNDSFEVLPDEVFFSDYKNPYKFLNVKDFKEE